MRKRTQAFAAIAFVLGAGCVMLSGAAAVAAGDTTPNTGWYRENGKCFYLQADGTTCKGEVLLDGVWYSFAPNGALQTGWQTVQAQRFYYDPQTGEAVFGWLTWRDETYYISETGGKCTGMVETDRGTAYFDAYGVLQTGWFTNADGRYYADETGVLATESTVIDGVPYMFAPNGKLQTGWQTVDGVRRYYQPEDGQPVNGWFWYRDARYYIDADTGKCVGEQTVDGKRYAFDGYGCQTLGWCSFADGVVQFHQPDGTALTGWQTIAGQTYYFSAEGTMQTGLLTTDEGIYFFSSTGEMQVGIVSIDGKRVVFAADGKRTNGWFSCDGQTYYCDENGTICTGWLQVEGETVYCHADGIVATGWQTLDGNRYYFSAHGGMQTGLVTVEGVQYAFQPNGTLAGEGWFQWNGQDFFCDAEGRTCTGWQTIGDVTYYFQADGAKAVNTTVDDFYLDADGASETVLQHTVQALLPECGDTPDTIYQYCSGHYRYRHMEDTRPLEALRAAGWDSLVSYTVNVHNGVCYYLAATMDYFLQQCGWTTRLVYANHNTGDHYWCQVLVDDAWHNYDPTYSTRGDMAWDAILAAGKYTVYGYVSIQYDTRGSCLGDTWISL